ncbi:1-aminocyclopropane-1-carboxylate oxidase homolog 5-like isoform X2 [Silene latifolia]|uniref:1-aminocyclopropane-1-carboxylate oxidase homolog 5-like isoform X2 n=1 Tax=Silene latifolia TaxID=37657 RepID=UPI003D77F864
MEILTTNVYDKQPKEPIYDRRKESEAFGKTRLGVKGLVDSGITRIPRMFHHPPETLFYYEKTENNDPNLEIPVIDMSMDHAKVVEQLRDASTKYGFFQVINHVVPVSHLDRLLDVVQAVHELPDEEKKRQYREDILASGPGFGFSSYHDLFEYMAASWCDTISVRLSPNPVDPMDIPEVCRNEVLEWDKEVTVLAERLGELLSEGLGLNSDKLKGTPLLERKGMVGHYYPQCPEPNKTIGTASHTDLGMFTILIQDMVGGLQVEYDGKWIDLKPVHGALVVNIGDLFQILSNDKNKSRAHSVILSNDKDKKILKKVNTK